MYQEKRKEDDLPVLKTALMHRYNDFKSTRKNTKENWLQPSETIIKTMDNRMTTSKQKCEGKQFYVRFKWLMKKISHQKTWTLLRKRKIKRVTESLQIAAQNNTERTNHIKARIDKTQQNSKCSLCSDRDETIDDIISECWKLAPKECKTRHDWVVKVNIRTNGICTTRNLW